jgi:hypothetical protein
LAARSGIPVAKILTEQEQRLISGTTREHQEPRQQVSKVAPLAIPDGAESNGRHPATEQQLVLQENGVHPEPSKAKTNPTLRTLDEQQKAFLAFLIANQGRDRSEDPG